MPWPIPQNCVPSSSIAHSSARRALDPPLPRFANHIVCLVIEPVQGVYGRAPQSVQEPSSSSPTPAATSHDAPKQVGSMLISVSIDCAPRLEPSLADVSSPDTLHLTAFALPLPPLLGPLNISLVFMHMIGGERG